MRSKGRKFTASLCLSLVAFLLSHGRGVAEPSRLLKGVTIIGYSIAVEETNFGTGCSIDENSLATVLRFVANQSTKLKVTPNLEVHRHVQDLFATRDKILKELSPSGRLEDDIRAMGSDRYVAANKAAVELISVPHLLFHINRLEVAAGGCVGIINAELSVSLDTTKMYHTHTTVYGPQLPIWSKTRYVIAPEREFGDLSSNVAEHLMKELVNDWSASQDPS
jgi:hypothetical protein